MSYSNTYIVKLLPSDTGLAGTLLAKIYPAVGAVRVTTGAGVGWTELGGGEYEFTYASFEDTDAVVQFYNGATYETSTTTQTPAVTSLTGIATATNVTDAVTAIETFGGAAPWTTASGFATPTNVSDLSTHIDINLDAKITSRAVPADVTASTAAIEAYGDLAWKTAVGFSTPTDITDSETVITDAIDDATTTIVNAIISDVDAGTGIIDVPITINNLLNEPLDGVFVEIKSGVTKVAAGYTNSNGTVNFKLDVGIYNMYRQLAGYTFTNPVELEVSLTDIIIRDAAGGSTTVVSYEVTVLDITNVPIEDVFVEIKTGTTVISAGYTNALGKISFWLNTGTYNMNRYKTGYSWTNPTVITVV